MSLAEKLKNQFVQKDTPDVDAALLRKQELAARATEAKGDFENNQKALRAISFLKQKGEGDEKAGFQALVQSSAKLQENNRGVQASLREMYEGYKDHLKTEGITSFEDFVNHENYKNEKEVLVAREMEALAGDPQYTEQESLKHLVKTFKDSYNIKLSENEDNISPREVETNIQAAETIARDRMLENMSTIKENDLDSIQLPKKVVNLKEISLVTTGDHKYVAAIGDEEKVKNVIKKVIEKKADELFAPEIENIEGKLNLIKEFKQSLSRHEIPDASYRAEIWSNFSKLDKQSVEMEIDKKANKAALQEKYLNEDKAIVQFLAGKEVPSAEYLAKAFSDYMGVQFPDPNKFREEADLAYEQAKSRGELQENERAEKFFNDWYAKKFKSLVENAPANTAYDAHELQKHTFKPPQTLVEFVKQKNYNSDRPESILSSFSYEENGKLRNITETKEKYKQILAAKVDVDWTQTTQEYKDYQEKYNTKEPLREAGLVISKIDFKEDVSINEEGEVIFKKFEDDLKRYDGILSADLERFQKEELVPNAVTTKPLFGSPKPKHEVILSKVDSFRKTAEALHARVTSGRDFEQGLLDEVKKVNEQVQIFNSSRTDIETLRQYTSKDKKAKEENQIREELEKQNVMKAVYETARLLSGLESIMETRRKLADEKAKIVPYMKFNGENLFKQLNLKGNFGQNIYGANHHIQYNFTKDEEAAMSAYNKASNKFNDLVKYVPDALK